MEPLAKTWADLVARAITTRNYRVVGCTTMFDQTSASIALLNRVKALSPATVTILGGANCEGEMAEGIRSIGSNIDHIFSSESDGTFVRFLNKLRDGNTEATSVIRDPQPVMDLDRLPNLDFRGYRGQLETFVPLDGHVVSYPVETSRGCWWGQKHHCTFCGLNGLQMTFRQKSPERVIDELTCLRNQLPNEPLRVSMTDNIMPYQFFETVVPRLRGQLPDTSIFYEQKANLTLEKVLALKQASIDEIQPGIESFSTASLVRMRKGVTAAQNLNLLRFARSAAIKVFWNLLIDFPGEQAEELTRMTAVVPLLHHLPPPKDVTPLRIERFSPYFDRPADFGLPEPRPFSSYADVFPSSTVIEKIAYFFDADYQSATRDTAGAADALRHEVERWRQSWMTGASPRFSPFTRCRPTTPTCSSIREGYPEQNPSSR